MTRQQVQINLTAGSSATEVHTQCAALCWRMVGRRVQVLLVTSRGTGRWILPKGWPMKDRSPAASAGREAYEEAGVIGDVSDTPMGMYSYTKLLGNGAPVPCVGMIYPLRVRLLMAEFPEMHQRKRKWFSRKKAARRVAEPELARLLRDFDPTRLS